MKQLYLIRHAKSSWEDASTRDFDRPLNARGVRDAADMSERFKHRVAVPDRVISSPALRAKTTAERFAETLGLDAKHLLLEERLYHAPAETYEVLIDALDDSWNAVAFFAHNPGITAFANHLDTAVKTDNMPTCGIFAVEAEVKQWKDFMRAKKRFLFFDYPKHK